MNQETAHQMPIIGYATRTGKRHSLNDDHCATFVVLRENTTRRLSRRQSESDEETVSLGALQDSSKTYKPNASIVTATTATQQSLTDWSDERTQKISIAVVADGVTMTQGGGKASEIAVESIRANLQDPPSRQETISEWLEFAIQRANEEILFEAKRNPELTGMSSTIALAALAGEKLYILHLGDSRAYLMRQNQLFQLTTDHTWAQESINSGAQLRSEGGSQLGSNHLLRYLGAQKLSAVDRGILSPTTDQREEYLLVEPGDVLLLCTDGFYRRLSHNEIVSTLAAHIGSPQQAVDQLIELAVSKGEQDDITAIVLEIPDPEEKFQAGEPSRSAIISSPAPTINWLRPALIILFTLILMVVVALLVWSWRA